MINGPVKTSEDLTGLWSLPWAQNEQLAYRDVENDLSASDTLTSSAPGSSFTMNVDKLDGPLVIACGLRPNHEDRPDNLVPFSSNALNHSHVSNWSGILALSRNTTIPGGAGGERPEGRGGERPEGRGGERPEGRGGERPEGRGGERPEGRGALTPTSEGYLMLQGQTKDIHEAESDSNLALGPDVASTFHPTVPQEDHIFEELRHYAVTARWEYEIKKQKHESVIRKVLKFAGRAFHKPARPQISKDDHAEKWEFGVTGVPKGEGTENPEATVNYNFGCTILKLNDPLCRNLVKKRSDIVVDECSKTHVYLDAVCKSDGWEISRLDLQPTMYEAWFDSPWSYEDFFRELCFDTKICSGTWCNGVISSVPFHDMAVAAVGSSWVLVPRPSLVTEDVIGTLWSPMEMFVEKGRVVSMKIMKYEGFVIAEECWDIRLREKEAIDYSSYVSNYCSAERIGRGKLICNDGELFVDTGSSHCSIRRDQIRFPDGSLGTDAQLRHAIGSIIACLYDPENVVYAEIGVSEPWEVLKRVLVVPTDMISLGTYYHAVVVEFGLSDYVICRIGVLPVLVLIRPGRGGLTRGSVNVIRVEQEKHVDGGCVLFGRLLPLRKFPRVLINIEGCVHSINKAGRGLIKADRFDLEVIFELNVVKLGRYKSHLVLDFVHYFQQVRKIVKVGTRVRFNAVHPYFMSTPYCVEVFPD